MDKYDALLFSGAMFALCGTILAAPLQLHEGNNLGMVLLFVGIIVMLSGIVLKFVRKA